MNEPPLPPPLKDWQSPEFGDAIRTILDAHSDMREPEHVRRQHWARLGALVRDQPEVTVGAFFALLNAALGLPALLPSVSPNAPTEIREQLERQVYGDIDGMASPA